MKPKPLLLIVLLLGGLSLHARPLPLDSIPPRDADVKSIEGIIGAVYDVISGDSGVQRNWDRLRSLFHPQARMISSGMRPDNSIRMRSLTVEEFISIVQPNTQKEGFFERELHKVTDQYGHIAHVFSTYESRHHTSDPRPYTRGINSFQLYWDGSRWWIMNLLWNSESPSEPIPGKYL